MGTPAASAVDDRWKGRLRCGRDDCDAADVAVADPGDFRRQRRLTMAPPAEPSASADCVAGHGAEVATSSKQGMCSSDVNMVGRFSYGKFWASVNEFSEEEVQNTSPSDVLIAKAARSGFQADDLIQAGKEIVAAEEVCFASPSSAAFRCPRARKSVNAIAKDRSLKQLGKPWTGSLPKPRISPPKTLGDAVIKNSFTRRRGGQLIPRLFKMALPLTIHRLAQEDETHYSRDHVEQWPPLLGCVSTQRRGEISATEKAPDVQTRFLKPDCVPDKVLIKNGKFQTRFYPSRGLNDLFSRARPKPDGINTSSQVLQYPSWTPHLHTSYQRRRSYADTLKMDAGGNGKASGC
jgi:hypothetical protein